MRTFTTDIKMLTMKTLYDKKYAVLKRPLLSDEKIAAYIYQET